MVLLAAAVSTPCRLRMKMMLESSSIEGCCHYHHYLPKNIERGRAVGNFILLFHLLLESDTEKNGESKFNQNFPLDSGVLDSRCGKGCIPFMEVKKVASSDFVNHSKIIQKVSHSLIGTKLHHSLKRSS